MQIPDPYFMWHSLHMSRVNTFQSLGALSPHYEGLPLPRVAFSLINFPFLSIDFKDSVLPEPLPKCRQQIALEQSSL